MEPSSFLELIFKTIKPFRLLEIAILLAFPIWLLYKFFPSTFNLLLSFIPTGTIPTWISSVITLIIQLLGAASVVSFCGLIFLSISKKIQGFLRGIFGVYNRRSDIYREAHSKKLFNIYVRSSIYIVALIIYSELILKNGTPVSTFQQTHAIYFISLLPMWLMVGGIFLYLIFP